MSVAKLKNDPILEAMLEVRFELMDGVPPDIVPGVLYPKLSEEYPNSQTLPAAKIPFDVRERDPNMASQNTHRFTNDEYHISVGSRSFLVTCPKPYKHWENFQPVILKALDVLESSNLVKKVTRVGLRYFNLLQVRPELSDQYRRINLQSVLGPFNLLDYKTNIRTEILLNSFTNAVTINPGAEVQFAATGEVANGLILDIDTVCHNGLDDFFKNRERILNAMHATESEIFFKSLSDAALKDLNN